MGVELDELLVLDDQLYTVEQFARQASARRIKVFKTDSVLPFKERALEAAKAGKRFAVAIDMNLPALSKNDLEEIGATPEEVGNGEAAGLVVARHVFMNGHDEPARSALHSVPIAMISAENLTSEVRHDIEQLHRQRHADTLFIPKPDNASSPIPRGATFDAFLDRFLQSRTSTEPGKEEGIFLDVRRLLKLNDEEAARILGFTGPVNFRHLFEHDTKPISRDWRDRLIHLCDIAVILISIFRRVDAKRWLNRPLESLDGRAPKETMLSGSIVDLLLVKQIVLELGSPN